MSALGGDLNRSTQHFILKRKDGVCGDKSGISTRFQRGRENRAVGSLAARRVAKSDRACVWQAVVVHLFPGCTARRDSPCTAASVPAGIDARGARRNLQGHCGASIGTIDGPVVGSLAL